MRPAEVGVNLQRLLNKRKSVGSVVRLHVRVGQKSKSLCVVRHIQQFSLKLASSLFKLILAPQQIAQTKMNVRLLGIRLDRGAKLLNGCGVVAHLVQRFSRKHIGLCRFGIQRENLVICIQNTLELPGRKTAVRQEQTKLQILRFADRGRL